MSAHLGLVVPLAPEADLEWPPGSSVIVATSTTSGVPTYELTRVRRQTDHHVITVEGVRFWKESCLEVGGTRQIIPDFAPVFPILRAQLASHEHRRAIGAAYWRFMDHPDREHAAALADMVHQFLDSQPD